VVTAAVGAVTMEAVTAGSAAVGVAARPTAIRTVIGVVATLGGGLVA
jgi:hypothetical protein